MPQPTKYSRQYNFNDYQTSSPSDPLPGSQVDGELNAVKTNLDGLNANIELIQRDDGKLANASVGSQQFDNGALALIGASGSGFTIKGDWAASTAYVVGDVVENSQATYYCSIAHTSGNAFADNNDKFVLIANAAISSAAIQVEKFTGNGSTKTFALSTTYGSDKDVMVFVGGSLRTPQSESSSTDTNSYTISGTSLTFVSAPPSSTTPNVFVWGTSVSVEAARQSALASSNTASGHSVDAGQHRNTANFWATKVDGTVVDEDTSVDSNDYSAKAYSIAEGTPTTIYVTVAGGKFVLNGKTISSGSDSIYNIIKGTTYTFDVSDSTNSGHQLEFSTTAEDTSPDYTVTRSGTAGQASATVTFAVPSDAAATVYFYCSVSGHSGMGATLTSIAESYAPTSGSSKEWASKTDGQVSGSEYSSKSYANSTDVNEPPTGSSKSWATQDTTAVASSLFSAKEYASGSSATGGSAKQWSQKTGSAVDTDYSSKVYAQDTSLGADTSGGSAKGWSQTAKDTPVPGAASTDRSAKHYSEVAATEASNATNQNRFLSPKSDSNVPATRDDGTTALAAGDMYFNTTQNKMKIRNASGAWQDTSASIEGVAHITEYTGSQATNSKWFAFTHDVGLQIVWLNGVRQVQGSDYYSTNANDSTANITSGDATHIYFISNIATTDVISVMGFGQIDSSAVVPVSGGNFTGAVKFNQDGNNTSFTLPTTRGTNNYVLTRDDTAGTGGTAWKETTLTPTITSLTYPTGDDGNATTALDSGTGAGTQTLIITGSNFTATVSSVQITVGGVTSALGSSYTRDSATQITVSQVVKRAAGTYTITVTNDTSLSATSTVDFSGTPSFTTAVNLGTVWTGTTLSKTIATSGGDGTVTLKADPNGGAKPDWMTIGGTGSGGSSWTEVTGSAGLSTALAGTTANSGATQTFNFGIIVRDSQNQGSDREFSLTVADQPTGGTLSSITGYRIHTWSATTTTTSTYTDDFVVPASTRVEILMIGGGGAGGPSTGGGGGAGGLIYIPFSSAYDLPAGTYTVVVGGGGTSIWQQTNDGANTTLTKSGYSLTAHGGGGGGSTENISGSNYGYNPNNGGSSGGAYGYWTTIGSGVSAPTGYTSPTQPTNTSDGTTTINGTGFGSAGGDGNAQGGGGGGGGATGAGTAGSSDEEATNNGLGGTGKQIDITGTNTWYAAGGSRGAGAAGTAASTNSIGGAGAAGSNVGGNGAEGTGSGGGGAWNHGSSYGGNGGSGIVIIRYAV